MIDCVTAAPVARRNAGARILRWASFQVPGKVAATSVFPCAKARAGTKDAAPSAAAPASMRLRSMVLTPLPVHSHALGNTRHAASDAATWPLSPGRRNAPAAPLGSLTLSEAPPEVSTS